MRGFDAWTLEPTAMAQTLPLHLPTLNPVLLEGWRGQMLSPAHRTLGISLPVSVKGRIFAVPQLVWGGVRCGAAMAQLSASFKAPQMFLMC